MILRNSIWQLIQQFSTYENLILENNNNSPQIITFVFIFLFLKMG